MSTAERHAILQQARAALARQDWATAAGCAEQLVQRYRNDPNGPMLLADVARARDDLDEELRQVERAIRHAPRSAALRLHLGRCLMSRGRYRPAVVQFEKAAKLEGGADAGRAGLAHVCQYQGRWERSRALLEPMVAKGPTDPHVGRLYLRVLAHDGDLDAVVSFGRDLLDAGHPPSDELRGACMEVARALEKQGDHAGALEMAARGNAMVPGDFDPGAPEREADALIATFTAETLARLPRPATPSERPIFIVGVPRCGSTLVERIIASHPRMHGAGEIRSTLHLVLGLADRLCAPTPYPACVAHLTAAHVEALAAEYLDELATLAPRAERVSNKDLANFRHLGLLSILFPRGRVIHCRRDPMDACLSCYMQSFASNTSRFTNDLEHLGRYHRQYRRVMAHYRDVIDMPLLEVDYEDLVTDQASVTRRIIEFCGVEWDDACLRPHEAKRHERTLSFDQVRRPMYASAIGRAARFGALLDPLRAALGLDEEP